MDNLTTVEVACHELAGNDDPITFTAVAERTGISRTTLYRNPDLRTLIEERQHNDDRSPSRACTTEIAHLRTGLEALADQSANKKNDSDASKHPTAANQADHHRTVGLTSDPTTIGRMKLRQWSDPRITDGVGVVIMPPWWLS